MKKIQLISVIIVMIFLVFLIEGDVFSSEKPELVIQEGHGELVNYMTFTSNGKYLISNDHLNTKIWDIKTGACVRSINFTNNIALSPDNKYIFATYSLCVQERLFKSLIISQKVLTLSEIIEDAVLKFIGHMKR